MKPIALKFQRGGYEFEQVVREGDVAIYGQKRPGQPGAWYYEVVKIRRRAAREAFGVQFEAGEYYPSSEEWGVFGWTYMDFPRAKGWMDTLIASKSKNGVTSLE